MQALDQMGSSERIMFLGASFKVLLRGDGIRIWCNGATLCFTGWHRSDAQQNQQASYLHSAQV